MQGLLFHCIYVTGVDFIPYSISTSHKLDCQSAGDVSAAAK